MFIKLTRFDGSPIWLNASFVVTIEPGRQGGAIVVPIGDGLDYEVRESPAEVLTLLGNAPAAEPVLVPVANSQMKAPAGARPEGGQPPKLAVKAEKPAAKSVETDAPPAADVAAEPSAAKPRVRKTATAKKTTRTRSKTAKKPVLDLTEEQVERLRKMAPGSVKKLQNTLVSQFNKTEADTESTVKALVAHGIVTADERERIVWVPSTSSND